MRILKIKEARKNNVKYFRLLIKDTLSKDVYFINHYERSIKKYSISKYDDVNYERFVSGEQLIADEI